MAERTVLVRLKAINDDYKKAMRESSDETTKLGKNIKGLQASSADIKDLGSKMQRNLTLPIAGVSTVATKLGVDFDTTFSRMVGLANVPRSEIDGLKQSVLDLAHETGRAPNELAQALYYIRSSGVSAAEGLNVLRAAARASAGGLGSTEDVAKAVGFAINAYGEQNLSAARATDILVAAVREGTIEADALAPVMGRLIPTASALGIGFDQVAGTLAVMSRTGLDAEEASTSLSAVFSTLLGTTKEGTALLEEKGLSLKRLREVAAGPGGVIAVMRMLGDAFGDDDEALSTIIPNVRAFRAFMNVLAQDAGSVDEVMQAVAGSTGAADEAFQAWASSKGAKLDKLFSDAKAALIRFGDTIDPLIVLLTTLGSAGAAAFGWLPQMGQQGVASILLVVAALGPMLSIVGAIGKNLQSLKDGAEKAFSLIQRGALNAVGSLGALGVAAGAAALVLGVIAVKWWENERAAKAAAQRANEWAEAIRNSGGDVSLAVNVKLDEKFRGGGEDMNNLLHGLNAASIGFSDFSAAVTKGGASIDEIKAKVYSAQLGRLITPDQVAVVEAHNTKLGALGHTIDGLVTDVGAGSKEYQQFNQLIGVSSTSANAAEARILGLTGGVAELGDETVDTAAALKDMLAAVDDIYAKAFGVLDAQLDYADALDQVGKSSDSASGSTRNLAAEQHSAQKATEAITDAQLGLAKAEEALRVARQGPTERDKHDAQLGVREAVLGVVDAQKALADAQKKVTEERKKGKDGDVKGAQIALQHAQIALIKAQDGVTDAQAAQNDVMATGAETSDKVKSAVDEVAAAQLRLRDAQWAQDDAQNQSVAGTGRVIDKQKELAGQIDTVIQKGDAAIRKMIEMGAPNGEVLTAISNQAKAIDDLIEKYGDVNGKLALQKQALLEIAILKGLPATYNAETGWVYYELPHKAMGGPVTAGMSYLVGERGPELFSPQFSGNITPNHQLTAASSFSSVAALPAIKPSEVVVNWDGHQVGKGLVQWTWDIGGAEFKVKTR